MEDSPEDLPKPPRTTAARPFFSPRPNSGEGTTGPLELSRRRAAQLFTPPGSSPATPLADRAAEPAPGSANGESEELVSSAADGSIEMTEDAMTGAELDGSENVYANASEPSVEHDVEFEGDWTPPPMVEPERSLDAESLASTNLSDDERLHIEQYEHEDIELTAAASNVPDEHAIEVIGYDDANSLLKAATVDGETPQLDGLRLESTEFSFGQAAPPPTINVDSFWANEPFVKLETTNASAATPTAADETEATIDAATAGEDEAELAIEGFGTEPSIDEQPLEWADDPSTTIAHAQAALEPEPEHEPEPENEPAQEPEEQAMPMFADIAPPWMNRATPASVQSLEELKESEPWDLTPSHSHAAIPVAPIAGAAPAARAGHDIADALERIASRVRDGELDVPTGTDLSDEAALSAVLTALLRMRR